MRAPGPRLTLKSAGRKLRPNIALQRRSSTAPQYCSAPGALPNPTSGTTQMPPTFGPNRLNLSPFHPNHAAMRNGFVQAATRIRTCTLLADRWTPATSRRVASRLRGHRPAAPSSPSASRPPPPASGGLRPFFLPTVGGASASIGRCASSPSPRRWCAVDLDRRRLLGPPAVALGRLTAAASGAGGDHGRGARAGCGRAARR